MKTIRTKLMIIMLSAALIIIFVLDFVAIKSINKTTKETLKSSATPFSVQGAKNFNDTVNSYVLALSKGAKSSDFSSAKTQNEMVAILKSEFPDDIKEEVVYSIVGMAGDIVYSTNENYASVITQNDVKEAMNTLKPVVTDLVIYTDSKNNKRQFFSIIQAIFKHGKYDIAAATIDTSFMESIMSNDAIGENGYVFVVNSSGDIVMHTDKNIAMQRFNPLLEADSNKSYKSFADATRDIVQNDQTSGQYDLNGHDYVFGASKTNYFDANLVYALTPDDFSETTTATLRSIILIAAILLILTVIASVIYSRRLSKPIVSATKRIRLLAQGNLSAPVDVWYSKDELGVLTSSLEETIVALRQYITLITVALNQISDGNLCHRMEGSFKGDFQQIKNTFNDIFNSLSDTFSSINTATEQVNGGAVQVSNSAQSVSQGSTQQASAIEELSVTLKDVSKQVEQNAADAKNAATIVTSNAKAIGDCNNDMGNMLGAINEIRTSSEEISKIIKVIDDIAFQTNILALNAAVEAAREGSKGFGVVADEVRRLASRSAEAAKQTASLIENSSAAVSKGSQIAEKTADSLNHIVESSSEIQTLVKNISDASEAQTEAITQINTGLVQISSVVSANTSASVGTASASEELSSQSLILKNMIARFRLDSGKKKDNANVSKFDYNDTPDNSYSDNYDEPESYSSPSQETYEYTESPEEDEHSYDVPKIIPATNRLFKDKLNGLMGMADDESFTDDIDDKY